MTTKIDLCAIEKHCKFLADRRAARFEVHEQEAFDEQVFKLVAWIRRARKHMAAMDILGDAEMGLLETEMTPEHAELKQLLSELSPKTEEG